MGNNFGNLIPRFTRRNRPTPTRTRTPPTRYNKYKFNSYAECENTLDSTNIQLHQCNSDLDSKTDEIKMELDAIDTFIMKHPQLIEDYNEIRNKKQLNEILKMRSSKRRRRTRRNGSI